MRDTKHSGRSFRHVQSFQQYLSKNRKTLYNKVDRNLQRKIYSDNLKLSMTKEDLSVVRKNEFNMQYMNNRLSRRTCGLRPIDCRYRRFESRSRHGCWSLGYVVFCVVIGGLFDGLSLPCLCVCVCVCDLKTSTRDGLQQIQIYKLP